MRKILLDGIVVAYSVVTTAAWIGVSAVRRLRRRARPPEQESALGYRVGRF